MHIVVAVIHFLAAARVIEIWVNCLQKHWGAAVLIVLATVFSVLSWYFPLRKYKLSGKKAYLLITVAATLVLLATIIFRDLIISELFKEICSTGQNGPDPWGDIPQWN